MKKRKMSALQRKYFGKGHKAHFKHKKSVGAKHMKKAYKYRGKRSYRGRIGGGLKGLLAPILGGVADSYLDPMLPVDGVGATAVGMFMHNATIKDLGLYKVGMSLGNILPLPRLGGGGTTGGGGL